MNHKIDFVENISDEEKTRLVNIMAYGEDIPPPDPKKVRMRMLKNKEPEPERFDECKRTSYKTNVILE